MRKNPLAFRFDDNYKAIRGKNTRIGTETDTNTVTSLCVQRVSQQIWRRSETLGFMSDSINGSRICA